MKRAHPVSANKREAAVSLASLNMAIPPKKMTRSPEPHAVAKVKRWTSQAAAAAAALSPR